MNHQSHQQEQAMGSTKPKQQDDMKIVPHSIEAEQQLLGAIMCNNEVYHRVSDILKDEHLYDPVHQKIYGSLVKRIRNGHLASPVTLSLEFQADEGLMQLGGNQYLVRLAGAAISAFAARDYAETIIDAYQRRILLEAIEDADHSTRHGVPMAEIQAGIELAGAKIVASDAKAPTISIMGAAAKALDMAHRAYVGEAVGLLSGIKSFDDLTGGFFPEDFVVLAGAPSMGKTAVALALAKAYAQCGHGVAFVSLEMGDYSLAQRMISSLADVPYRSMRRGSFSEDHVSNLQRATKEVAGWPVEIVQGHVRDVTGIFAAGRRIQRTMEGRVKGGLRVMIVDYLQLVRAPAKDRFQMISEVSQGLKNIAKQMGIPVIALAQINARQLADRDDKRPRLADIRESGQIEQDADVILFTHRDHYHLERSGPPRGKNGQVSTEALVDYEAALKTSAKQMDLILAKHRHDGIGSIKLGCDMATNRLWDLHDGDVAGAMGFF
jgi:replicative DNA helicase